MRPPIPGDHPYRPARWDVTDRRPPLGRVLGHSGASDPGLGPLVGREHVNQPAPLRFGGRRLFGQPGQIALDDVQAPERVLEGSVENLEMPACFDSAVMGKLGDFACLTPPRDARESATEEGFSIEPSWDLFLPALFYAFFCPMTHDGGRHLFGRYIRFFV